MPCTIWKNVGRYDMDAIRANMTNKPAKVDSTNVRFLKMDRGMSGVFARRSASTNSADIATTPANSPMICGESQSYSTPPHEVASTSITTAAEENTVPHTSNEASDSLCRGFGRKKMAATAATIESGTLIQNAQCQLRWSVNSPPKSGPTSMGSTKATPMAPMYLPRLRAGTTSAMMACAKIISPPPPRPWMPRPAISMPMFDANAHTTEPTVNSTSAKMNSPLRPMRSPTLP